MSRWRTEKGRGASELRRIKIACVRDTHPNWPAQVELVRGRVRSVAEELGEADTLSEDAVHSRYSAQRLLRVEFLTSSTRVWKNWGLHQRMRSYSERLISGYLADLPGVALVARGVPHTLGVGAAIQQAVERGHTVVLHPRASGEPPVVIRTAALDMESGALSVSEQRLATGNLTEVDLRRLARAEVLDW